MRKEVTADYEPNSGIVRLRAKTALVMAPALNTTIVDTRYARDCPAAREVSALR